MKVVRYFSAVLIAFAMVGCVDEPAAPDATVGEAVEIDEPVETDLETVSVIPEESSISWVGRKVTGKHDGGFEEFDGTLAFAGGEPRAIDFTIDMTTVTSDNDRLTGHLKSGDFFLVEEYPVATFESKAIEKTGDAAYQITGNLEMRGETRSVTFPARVQMSGETIDASSQFTINRHDWGVSYAGAPDNLIRDEVEVMLDLSFPKPESLTTETKMIAELSSPE